MSRTSHGPASLLALLASLGLAGCSGSDGSSPTEPDPLDPTGQLECERQGYPCSPSEVSLEILERTTALSDSVLAMFDVSTNAADAVSWLESRDGVAEAAADGPALRFRLEDGIGMWILGEGALSVPGLPPGSAANPLAASTLEPSEPARHIVAAGDESKRALIVAPARFDFVVDGTDWGSALKVKGILENTRGYEGRVRLRENEDSTSTTVGIASYKDWGEEDVVHVSSHGRRVCEDGTCRAVLIVNDIDVLVPGAGSREARFQTIQERGVELVERETRPGRLFVALNAEFFKAAYGGGLEDAIVVLSACQSFGSQATDLVDALQGPGTVVLGWTDVVYTGEASQAEQRFYKEMAENGYPAHVAFEKLGDLRFGSWTGHGDAPPVMRITDPEPGGEDLHIREVVTLLHPGTGQDLTANDRVQIEGIKGDGEEDEVPFRVRVDGVPADDAPEMILHVSVDDVQAEPVTVSSGTPNDEDQWIVEGLIPLGYDLEEDRSVEFLARVELATGGESEHKLGATLTAASWTLESEGSMTGVVTVHGQTEEGAESWSSRADFGVDGEGRVVGDGVGLLSGAELLVRFDDEKLYCLVAAPVELGFAFDLTGEVEGGRLRMQATNLRAVEFSASSLCEGITEAQIQETLLAILSTTLETDVPFEHEAMQEREAPVSAELSHDGAVVGSAQALYQWVNTIRKEGCPVGAADPDCQ